MLQQITISIDSKYIKYLQEKASQSSLTLSDYIVKQITLEAKRVIYQKYIELAEKKTEDEKIADIEKNNDIVLGSRTVNK